MSTSGGERRCAREVLVERDRVRRLRGIAFGWIDARIKSDGWLGALGPKAVAVYVFLCLAANHDGVSWYTRARIGSELGLADGEVFEALDRLEALDLVAYRPFSTYAVDGWRQVLSTPSGGPRGLGG
jgi:hypothetical protein